MTTANAIGAHDGAPPRQGRAVQLLPLGAGLILLYGPAYLDLARGLWQTDAQAHAPLVGLVSLALLWRSRSRLAALPVTWAPALALTGLIPGLLLAVVGLAQHLHLLTLLSQPLVIGGAIAMLYGRSALKITWFPLVFLLFMVPLPGIFIDAVTGELKLWISVAVEELLYALGYPVARSGVMLTVGQYQLLVADACSGLHSMISLSALGTLYVWLVQPRSLAHNLVLVASLIPIAFAANLVRVLMLVLATYHLGDGVAQALHDFLGMGVFIVALGLLIGLDRSLAATIRSPGQ